jgi:hypothetical protein
VPILFFKITSVGSRLFQPIAKPTVTYKIEAIYLLAISITDSDAIKIEQIKLFGLNTQ